MSDPVRTATAELSMSHAQFVIRDWNYHEPLRTRLAGANGLVGTNSRGAVVLTGIHTGRINLTVELTDSAPQPVDLPNWDDVVEVSVNSDDGELIACGIMQDPPAGLPELSHAGPGPYRLRAHARGRDTAPGASPDEPVEDYKISIWPAPATAETVYKQTDTRGQEIRARRS